MQEVRNYTVSVGYRKHHKAIENNRPDAASPLMLIIHLQNLNTVDFFPLWLSVPAS